MSPIRIPARHQSLVAILLLVVIAMGIWSIISRIRGKSEKVIVRRIVSSVASGSARETAKFLGNKGQIVVIGADAEPDSRFDKLLREFKDEVEGYGKIRVLATEIIADNRLEGGIYGVAIPAPPAAELLEKYRDADAIVSLIGVLLTDADAPPPPDRKPRIIALTWSLTGVKDLIQKKGLDMAIVPRYQRPPPPDSGNPKKWFERDRQVVTAANANTLPE